MSGEIKLNEKDIIWFVEKWFETHGVLSNDNYKMLKEMIEYKIKKNDKNAEERKATSRDNGKN
jgi:hypothetical protein